MGLTLKPCIDCTKEGVTTKRVPALKKDGSQVPGGRCVSHERAKKKERQSTGRDKRWGQNYGISPEEYWLIYAAQGGVCYMCMRAKGHVRALSVDHDHKTGMVRGLLCLPCNRNILGHSRDDIEFFERAIKYLKDPPAVSVIGVRIVPNHIEE